MRGRKHLLTQEQHNFFIAHIKGRSNQELVDLMNKTFSLSITRGQVKNYKQNHKLPPSGKTGRFVKGHIPVNKGKKIANMPRNAGMFKKGNLPKNHRPVGSERIGGDGYAYVKIGEPNKWKQKHILIWEKENKRKKPARHVIIFADRNRLNFAIENLLLVPCREFLRMNKHGLIKNDTELTKTGLIIAKLQSKMNDRRKK